MNDVQTPDHEAAETPSSPTAPEPRKGGVVRLVILLVILLAALGGLLYDYQVARPAVEKARTALDKMLDGTTKDPDGDGTFSAKEVHQLLGREPNVVEAIEGGKKEIYYWQSGLPFRKYKIVIAFWGSKHPLLNSYAINSELREDQMPPKGNIQVRELTEEEKKNFVPMNPMGMGAGSGGRSGSGKKASRPSSKRPRHKGGTKGGGGHMSAIAPPAGETPDDDEKSATPNTEPQKSATPVKETETKKETKKPVENKTPAATEKTGTSPAAKNPAKATEPSTKKESTVTKPKSEPAKAKTPEKKTEAAKPPAKKTDAKKAEAKKSDATKKETEKKDDAKKG